MTIHLDTSALVGALAEPYHSFDRLRAFVDEGHRVGLSSIALYEWLRGPRTVTELRAQEDLFPSATVVPFEVEAARRAAELYSTLPRSRGRAAELAIAACALVNEAALWTLNPKDFSDVPGLKLRGGEGRLCSRLHGPRRRAQGSSVRPGSARSSP